MTQFSHPSSLSSHTPTPTQREGGLRALPWSLPAARTGSRWPGARASRWEPAARGAHPRREPAAGGPRRYRDPTAGGSRREMAAKGPRPRRRPASRPRPAAHTAPGASGRGPAPASVAGSRRVALSHGLGPRRRPGLSLWAQAPGPWPEASCAASAVRDLADLFAHLQDRCGLALCMYSFVCSCDF